jgi:hypothetical protein
MATGDGTGILQEVAFVSIQAKGGTAVQFAGIIEDISFGGGEKATEGVPLVNGGRVVKRTPMTDHEITLKIYPTDTQWNGSDLIQQYAGTDDGWDAAEPFSTLVGRYHERYQVCVLWTEDTTVTTANSITTAGKLARRHILKEARIQSFAPDFSDKQLSAEVVFKGPAFDQGGSATLTIESAKYGGSAGLSAVTSYS